MKRFEIPSKTEFEDLSDKIDALSQKVDDLKKE
jgi:hypothetical protein